MNDIDGIPEALAVLEPRWPEIEEWFQAQNETFLAMMASDHDVSGRVLKCHLVVERFMSRFLAVRLGEDELKAARLSFHKKACLLPSVGSPASLVKPGILKLNAVRNDFGHSPDAVIPQLLGSIDEVLAAARPGIDLEAPIEKLEAFAAVACAFLLVPPEHLADVFHEAFQHVHANVSS